MSYNFDEYQRLLAEGERRRLEEYGPYTPSDYEEKAPSAASGTAAQIVGLGGSIAGKKLIEKYLAKKATEEVAKDVATKEVAKQVATQAAQAPTIGGSSSAFVDSLPAIGQNADGTLIYPGQVPATPGGFSFSGVGSAGNYLLPMAGAMGAYDLFKNERRGGRGIAQGAASGAAMGSYFGVPGAVIGGVLGGGIGLANNMSDKDRYKEEGRRVKKLLEAGVTGWDQLAAGAPELTRGRSKDELVAIEEAKIAAGKYGNPTFARSRDVKDLNPEDIWGYSAFGEKYGNDWLGKYSEGQRKDIAKAYLDAGAVSEGRGQISLKETPDLTAKIQALLSGASPTLAVVNPQPGLTTSTKMAAPAPVVVVPPSTGGGAFNLPMTGDVSKEAKAKRYNDFRREGAYR
ncbi:MAG TPA: hypothetical protein PLJ74_05440 [Myxococcota bacterium]|nr:hypothetical protein [Myxococcota bacterium]